MPSSSEDERFYDVDSDLGLYTCVSGATGKFCKHQAAVVRFFDVVLVILAFLILAFLY